MTKCYKCRGIRRVLAWLVNAPLNELFPVVRWIVDFLPAEWAHTLMIKYMKFAGWFHRMMGC